MNPAISNVSRDVHPAEPVRKVLICIANHPNAIRLLTAGQAQAQKLNLPLEVLHLQPQHSAQNYEYDGYSLNALKRATQMGAKIIQRYAADPYSGIVHYLYECARRGESFGAIIIGKLNLPWWKRWFYKDLGHQLKRVNFKTAVVEVIDLGEAARKPAGQNWNIFELKPWGLVWGFCAIALATLFIEAANYFMPFAFGPYNRNRIIIYVTAFTFSAGRFGLIPGIFASALSFMALKFLYDSPINLIMPNPALFEVVSFALFMVSSILIALFVSRTRLQREFFASRATLLQALFQLHRVTLTEQTKPDLFNALHNELSAKLQGNVAFFLPKVEGDPRLEVIYPDHISLSNIEKEALEMCWQESKTTGYGSSFYGKLSWRFEPLHTSNSQVGVLGVQLQSQILPPLALRQLLNAIGDQLAIILEHFDVDERIAQSHIRADREKLRAMLLSSVSHDLKTPLASVIGSLSVYRSMGSKLPQEQRSILIDTAIEEAQRLDNFITNILDMTRIESGDITFKKEWFRPADMVSNVQKRLRMRLAQHQFKLISISENVQICADAMMSEQVLQNVLDNAVKYTAKDTEIELTGQVEGENFMIRVRDHGKGIPDNDINRVFDKYARLHRTDSQVAGTGLGLAIAKAIMQGQEGDIVAANHPDGGAVFTLTFRNWRYVNQNTQVV